MPGLIDCHVHVGAWSLDLWSNTVVPASLSALRSARVTEEVLGCGFTTLHDLGGADTGLVCAVEDGLVNGPRLITCSKGLTVTLGHTDPRLRGDNRPGLLFERVGSMSVIADVVDDVRATCPTMIKEGAKFIKVMANGGAYHPMTRPTRSSIHAMKLPPWSKRAKRSVSGRQNSPRSILCARPG
nr:amidohydrolase family protein [Marinicella sp. W31]MDC2880049.1 amidohydrolase family protein [Marinicella sp. W31]